jgi:hypothetical protein
MQVIGRLGRQGEERGSGSGQATLASSPFQLPMSTDQNRIRHGGTRGLRASVAGFLLAPVPHFEVEVSIVRQVGLLDSHTNCEDSTVSHTSLIRQNIPPRHE